MKIEVIDTLMGNGKTHSTLRYIENLALNMPSECWIYATQYLDEIEVRTKENDKASHMWRTPTEYGDETKTDDFIALLKEPKVQLIAISHKLLIESSYNEKVNELLKRKGYKLFLDETLDLITQYNGVKKGDFLTYLKDRKLSINADNGKVSWLAGDDGANGLRSSFDQLRKDSDKESIYCAISSGSVADDESVSIVHIAPAVLFSRFSRMIVATYQIEDTLFSAYLDIKGFERTTCKDVICGRNTTKQQIRELITFVNKWDSKFRNKPMSSNWWAGKIKTCATIADIKNVNKAIRAIGDANGCKGNPAALGFTVPAGVLGTRGRVKTISPIGYPPIVSGMIVDDDGDLVEVAKGKGAYIPCNARASNAYVEKTVMVHAYSRFSFPQVNNYLNHCWVAFSNEAFATNEIIQWVWRSAIREGKPIKLAILDSRMRNLFTEWLAKE